MFTRSAGPRRRWVCLSGFSFSKLNQPGFQIIQPAHVAFIAKEAVRVHYPGIQIGFVFGGGLLREAGVPAQEYLALGSQEREGAFI